MVPHDQLAGQAGRHPYRRRAWPTTTWARSTKGLEHARIGAEMAMAANGLECACAGYFGIGRGRARHGASSMMRCTSSTRSLKLADTVGHGLLHQHHPRRRRRWPSSRRGTRGCGREDARRGRQRAQHRRRLRRGGPVEQLAGRCCGSGGASEAREQIARAASTISAARNCSPTSPTRSSSPATSQSGAGRCARPRPRRARRRRASGTSIKLPPPITRLPQVVQA